ncbi:MAG TPA: bis(5'-nucleosyl)-tetraphosphatase [Steroidobacteraceae bacterium]|nr:bis(5'-nucleosyl)-tetraphosphatase [Steroidobacteraceae bacterium]
MKLERPPTLSAGVVVVRRAGDQWLFLMLRAYRNWDFPKGVVEPGEDPFAAAQREVAEETTLSDLKFDWGDAFCETAPYGRNKVARYYIGRTTTERVALPVTAELGRPEHHEYRWVSYEQARQLASPRLQPVLAWAAKLMGIAPASTAA